MPIKRTCQAGWQMCNEKHGRGKYEPLGMTRTGGIPIIATLYLLPKIRVIDTDHHVPLSAAFHWVTMLP